MVVVLSEHHASPDGYLPSPLMLASAMAARTQQVHFVIGAALLPFYDPIRLAEDMAVLDHVSTGRVSYVLGLGYRPEEFAMYGVPMKERGRIADRKLALLLAAKGGEPFEHDGRTIWVTPAPATSGGPRVAGAAGRSPPRRAWRATASTSSRNRTSPRSRRRTTTSVPASAGRRVPAASPTRRSR